MAGKILRYRRRVEKKNTTDVLDVLDAVGSTWTAWFRWIQTQLVRTYGALLEVSSNELNELRRAHDRSLIELWNEGYFVHRQKAIHSKLEAPNEWMCVKDKAFDSPFGLESSKVKSAFSLPIKSAECWMIYRQNGNVRQPAAASRWHINLD